MSAPYQVWIDDVGDHEFIDCATLDEAIAEALKIKPHPYVRVRVIGDGYDAEYTSEGARECSDGLTDEERERVEEAGF